MRRGRKTKEKWKIDASCVCCCETCGWIITQCHRHTRTDGGAAGVTERDVIKAEVERVSLIYLNVR